MTVRAKFFDEDALKQFVIGDEFYVDFTPAPK